MSKNDPKAGQTQAPAQAPTATPAPSTEGLKIPTLGATASTAPPPEPTTAPAPPPSAVPPAPPAPPADMTPVTKSDVAEIVASVMAAFEQRMAAKNHPVNSPTGRESDYASRFNVDIPVAGDLDEILRRPDLTVEASNMSDATRLAQHAELLAFNEENLLVQVHESGDPNEQKVFPLSVNGEQIMVTRGVPTVMKRKYVERLCRAKNQNSDTKVLKDANGDVVNRFSATMALLYPHVILRDLNPRGSAWHAALLRER